MWSAQPTIRIRPIANNDVNTTPIAAPRSTFPNWCTHWVNTAVRTPAAAAPANIVMLERLPVRTNAAYQPGQDRVTDRVAHHAHPSQDQKIAQQRTRAGAHHTLRRRSMCHSHATRSICDLQHHGAPLGYIVGCVLSRIVDRRSTFVAGLMAVDR